MKRQKKAHALHLYSLYRHWFCHENEKKELSTSFFRRMQVQGEEKKMPQFKDVEFESDLDSDWLKRMLFNNS